MDKKRLELEQMMLMLTPLCLKCNKPVEVFIKDMDYSVYECHKFLAKCHGETESHYFSDYALLMIQEQCGGFGFRSTAFWPEQRAGVEKLDNIETT
jgi:hypothetical protein